MTEPPADWTRYAAEPLCEHTDPGDPNGLYGPERCGQDTVPGTDYCEEHQP